MKKYGFGRFRPNMSFCTISINHFQNHNFIKISTRYFQNFTYFENICTHSRVTCSLKYEGFHLTIFATNHCLELNSFVFFSGIVSIRHACMIYFLTNYLRIIQLLGGNTLVYSIITTSIATVRIVRYLSE